MCVFTSLCLSVCMLRVGERLDEFAQLVTNTIAEAISNIYISLSVKINFEFRIAHLKFYDKFVCGQHKRVLFNNHTNKLEICVC